LYRCKSCHKHEAIKKGIRRNQQKYFCLNCRKYFSRPLTRKSAPVNNEVLLDHLEGISYRKLQNRTGVQKKKLCQIVNMEISNLPDNLEMTKQCFDQLKYSGNLVVDGKYVPVKEFIDTDQSEAMGKIPKSRKRQKVKRGKVLIWGADYDSHDLPHFEFGDSESDIVFNDYFHTLKANNYPLKSLTTDDKGEAIRAVRRHYPDCVIQLCTKHYMAKLNRALVTQSIAVKLRVKEKKIEKLFPEPESECIPVSRKYSLKQIVKLANEMAELEFRYELLFDFQSIIIGILTAPDYQTAQDRIESLDKYFWPKRQKMNFPKEQIRLVKKLLADFRDNQEYLLNYLKYPHLNIPATTNLLEGFNSQLELRLSSIRGFETIATAKNYINAWIIKRRLTKFTDCRNGFKKLNGKSPLECAGVDISKSKHLLKAFRF